MTKSNVKASLQHQVTKRLKSCDSDTKDLVSLQSDKISSWYTRFTKDDTLYNNYMANEWGFEVRNNDNKLFEKLCLEGAQAGLSWRTILYKRQAYRNCFHDFDIIKVSEMTSSQIDEIMALESRNKQNHNIVVRHRGKLESIVNNAKQILTMSDRDQTFTTFSNFLWSFVNDEPILNSWSRFEEIPSTSEESEKLSKALKSHGFKFVGATTCYSLMQSCGLVIDHPVNTPEWQAAYGRLQKREGGYQERKK